MNEQRRSAKQHWPCCGSSKALGAGLQPVDQPEVDQYIAALRMQLDEARFRAAWAEGRAMSLDEAVSYVLGSES